MISKSYNLYPIFNTLSSYQFWNMLTFFCKIYTFHYTRVISMIILVSLQQISTPWVLLIMILIGSSAGNYFHLWLWASSLVDSLSRHMDCERSQRPWAMIFQLLTGGREQEGGDSLTDLVLGLGSQRRLMPQWSSSRVGEGHPKDGLEFPELFECNTGIKRCFD